jgi:tetratricopeptide (TPR) repeat protein
MLGALLGLLLAWVPISIAAGQQPAPISTPKAAGTLAPSAEAIELVNEGNSLLSRNDFLGAAAAYQKAVQDDPAFAEAHRGLGIALWRQGRLTQAWQELSTVARLEPDSAQAHYELGQLAWRISGVPSGSLSAPAGLSRGDFRALALSEAAKAVSLDPHNFEMRITLAEIELAAGRKTEAQADALGASSLAASATDRARALVLLARAYFATGDEVRAEAEYNEAIKEDPSNGQAYFGLGQLALFQRDAARAQKYFNRAIQASPDLAPAYAALGKLMLQQQQRGEAVAMLQKAVALDPGDFESQYELGRLLLESGDATRAKEMFAKIAAARPDYLPAGEQLALIDLREGDVQSAIARAQALVSRHPRAAEGHRVLALAYWRERQMDMSLAECAQALVADPGSTSMLALQALELWQTKARKEAQQVLHEAAHSDPTILSPVAFCRQIVCSAGDIPIVDNFLRQNRWVLEAPDSR